MKIKKMVVDCEDVIYPFGKGMPYCLKKIIETKELSIKNLLPCKMKQCERYKLKEIAK